MFICNHNFQIRFQLNKKVTGFILINDLDGFGMKHLWKPSRYSDFLSHEFKNGHIFQF